MTKLEAVLATLKSTKEEWAERALSGEKKLDD